ncbi:MAG: phosphotransferase [Candidatus Latescibacteria bacterium]|nr:phosphotransferase [Candidatus Latescibacterota bacterium]
MSENRRIIQLPAQMTDRQLARRPLPEWIPALEAIRSAMGLPVGVWRRFHQSQTFALDPSYVVKLRPPRDETCVEREEIALRLVAEWALATPEVVGSGDLYGWRYLVTTRLDGNELAAWRDPGLWGSLTYRERAVLCGQIGEAAAGLHAHAVDRSRAGFGNRRDQWEAPITASIERQRGFLDPKLIDDMERFLQTVPAPDERDVLLHGDLRPGNMMVHRAGSGWHLHGLFDFEDSLAGPGEWDFIAVARHCSQGNGRLFREFLTGYGGFGPGDYEALRARLLAVLLRWDRLERHDTDFPKIKNSRSWAALGDCLFGVG